MAIIEGKRVFNYDDTAVESDITDDVVLHVDKSIWSKAKKVALSVLLNKKADTTYVDAQDAILEGQIDNNVAGIIAVNTKADNNTTAITNNSIAILANQEDINLLDQNKANIADANMKADGIFLYKNAVIGGLNWNTGVDFDLISSGLGVTDFHKERGRYSFLTFANNNTGNPDDIGSSYIVTIDIRYVSGTSRMLIECSSLSGETIAYTQIEHNNSSPIANPITWSYFATEADLDKKLTKNFEELTSASPSDDTQHLFTFKSLITGLNYKVAWGALKTAINGFMNLDQVLKNGSVGTAGTGNIINISTDAGRHLSFGNTGYTIFEGRDNQQIQFRLNDAGNTSYVPYFMNKSTFFAQGGTTDLGGPSNKWRNVYQSILSASAIGTDANGKLIDASQYAYANINELANKVIDLPVFSDLNLASKTGISTYNASTTNAPTSDSGFLEVISSGTLVNISIQTATTSIVNNNRRFIRYNNNGTFSDWVEVATEGSIIDYTLGSTNGNDIDFAYNRATKMVTFKVNFIPTIDIAINTIVGTIVGNVFNISSGSDRFLTAMESITYDNISLKIEWDGTNTNIVTRSALTDGRFVLLRGSVVGI